MAKKKVTKKAAPKKAAKKAAPKATELTFRAAFEYPLNRAAGLLNILWLIVPIYGWFLVIGYTVRIIQEFIDGKYKELPRIEHGDDFALGFVMFFKYIPLAAFTMMVMGIFQEVGDIVVMFTVPMLAMNFIDKMTVAASFDFRKVKAIYNNFGEFVVAVLNSLLLFLVFGALSLVLIGIPCMFFAGEIFMANFFRKYARD